MDYKYDYSKLLGIMREKGITQEILSDKTGICEGTINNKLTNKTQNGFTQNQISKVCDALDIEFDNIPLYFFTHRL